MERKRVEASPMKSPLEALPLDILVKVLCGVEHEDLNQLFFVSKTIREGTLIAKKTHFEYSTPKKNTFAFHDPIVIENAEVHEIEAPNAPLRKSNLRLNGKKFDDISVNLFDIMEEEM
ncbi:hypothetical protein TanjilG_13064 [Lupinus angustifolius]|uniref:F-box domain-containing protein n=1 Tax=Lupinus angustifolius TaxID=3871 RepID=A0A1J7H2X1_LUPAN|nr:PREDICTED: F-box protein At1g61340-like [Lupinus angustifolius]OIV96132.1 hypothetical protein TanjilG_13064 [Lupinus angustifolius]